MKSNRYEQTAWRLRVLAVIVAAGLATGPGAGVTHGPELPNPGNPMLVSHDEQLKLGLQVAQEVYKQMPVLPDSSPETKYIQKLGKRLVDVIPPEHSWPFQFHVVAQKEINAFALPGGPMFVNLGTITAADNEAELAGVMAHEMSHVYMQHSAKQQEKGALIEGLAGLAGAIAGSGTVGSLARMGIQVGAGTVMLKYSRTDEAQADAVGAIILWKAGYNPVALADFFKKLEGKGSAGPQFLSDHPNPGNREAAIQKEIAPWPARQYSGDSPDFSVAKAHAKTLKAYTAQEIADGAKSGRWASENKKNGAVFPGSADASPGAPPPQQGEAAGVPWAAIMDLQPSSYFKSADLGGMKIDHPENWEVTPGDAKPSATIAPHAGVADSAVAYGVVVQIVRPTDTNANAKQVTASIVENLEKSDSNMKQAGEIQSLTVNGISGANVELQTVSPMPDAEGRAQPERDWLVTLPRGSGDAVFLVFVAPQMHFAQFQPTFEKMLHSVKFQ